MRPALVPQRLPQDPLIPAGGRGKTPHPHLPKTVGGGVKFIDRTKNWKNWDGSISAALVDVVRFCGPQITTTPPITTVDVVPPFGNGAPTVSPSEAD